MAYDFGCVGDGVTWWMSSILLSWAAMLILFANQKANYGRYWNERKFVYGVPLVPGKVAWVIQELPALLIPLFLIFFEGVQEKCDNFVNKFFLGLFLLHYFQRSLIYPLLMKGSKPTPLHIFAFAFIFCGCNGYLQGRYFLQVAKYSNDWIFRPPFVIGTVVFFAGMAINIHSDNILRNLRAPGETGYKIPKGGVFEFVSGANFLGEIIEWFGLAVASGSYPMTAFASFSLAFIGSRATQHHRFYLERFKDYPKSRKALIPFLL